MPRLDDVPWVPTAPGESSPPAARPVALLPAGRAITHGLVRTFPVAYLREKTGLEIPSLDLPESVYSFLHSRRHESSDKLWTDLHGVFRPGTHHPWPPDSRADENFLELLGLTETLQRLDPEKAGELLRGLAGDEQARLIPVARPDGRREFVGVPDPESSTAGRRGVSVMGRLGGAGIDPLDPPSVLDVSFVAEGVLSAEDLDRAKPFGLRPFAVDAILDRLNKVAELGSGPPADFDELRRLVRFLWALLTRERRSEFGTAAVSTRALTFASPEWFWLQPGRAGKDETARLRQRRERSLAEVPLPARDGTWHPAGTLAFGADWADWVDENLPYTDRERRVAAMRRLELLAPTPGSLLGPPSEVLALLPAESATSRSARAAESPTSNSTDESNEPDTGDLPAGDLTAEEQQERVPLEQLAFLLRLGCWEVPPVEGHDTRQPRFGVAWPWPGIRRGLVPDEDKQEWNFDFWRWSGTGHRNVTVTEDARLRWPLVQDGREQRIVMAAAVADGAALYCSLAHASALCRGCSTPLGNSHQRTYHTQDGQRRPSTLALQLQRQAWIPAARAGKPVGARSPSEVWWDPRGLDAHALRTSPLQHLPLAEVSAWPTSLRTLCGVLSLTEGSPKQLQQLLAALRRNLEQAAIDFTSGTTRQTFISLHRLICEALSASDPAEHLPENFEVLCELGSRLVHRPRGECRHDDGKYVGYKGRFSGRVPFVILARDKQAVAAALSIPPFEVTVRRQDDDNEGDGEDITGTLRDELTDRIPEILAVMVHHAGGTNPLDPTGDAFKERARRLSELRVRRLRNLTLDASVVGLPGVREIIGDRSQDESYLDTSRPGSPVIYHDFAGEDWRPRLRRRLAGHLAALTDVAAAYTDTFTLLLTAGESEREDLLQSWGVTHAHVQDIRTQLGIVTDEDRSRTGNWLRAVLAVLGKDDLAPEDPSLDHQRISELLIHAGLPRSDADVLAEGLTSPIPGDPLGPVLPTLLLHRVDLSKLSAALAARGEPRLRIRVARDRLATWVQAHGPRLVAVLLTAGRPEEDAKAAVVAISSPAELEYTLDPTPGQYLSAVVAALWQQGLHTEADPLATEPANTLAKLVGLSVEELDERARQLYDAAARNDRLVQLAQGWARELRLLAVLARSSGATSSAIRREAQQIDRQIGTPVTPAGLIPTLDDLLPGKPLTGFRQELAQLLVDDLPGIPANRDDLLALGDSHGLPTAEAQAILRAIAAPRTARVATLIHQAGVLMQNNVRPLRPPGLAPPPGPKPKPTRDTTKNVPAVKVDVNADRRKKKAGDEAESWALAALITPLLALDDEDRRNAIEEVLGLLEDYRFLGEAVDQIRAYGREAMTSGRDDEELTHHLSKLIHASNVSDMFGFDMLGWLPDEAEASGRPIALEVKNSSDGTFYLSSGEWQCGERLRATDNAPAAYAVLVVRRKPGSDAPVAMDLLVDPVHLHETAQLKLDVDTYRASYGAPSPR